MGKFVYKKSGEQHTFSFLSGQGDISYLKGLVRGFPKGQVVPSDKETCCVRNELNTVNFDHYATLSVSKRHLEDAKDVDCFTISLKSHSKDYYPEIEIDLEPNSVYWYGGAELFTQHWPMNNISMPENPYLSFDYLDRQRDNRVPGPVLERYWINSRGVGVFVDKAVPLRVSWDSTYGGQFRLKAKFDESQYTSVQLPADGLPTLVMEVYKASNVKHVHQTMSAVCFNKPLRMPDERMVRSPIWSTWATYKVDIDQDKVINFAQDILKHGFSNSQLEIDDMFSSFYGDIDFSKSKFSDPKAMITELKEMGFRVTVWVMPFANLDSEAFREGMAKGYFMKEPRGQAPALVKWWQGIGAILDLTNPQAVDWYSQRLSKLQQEYGVDSFKFDSGEIGYLPTNFKTHRPLETPGEYTTLYNKLIGSFGGMVEMRSVFMSHEYATFVRVMDKDSCWGYENGLQSLIPSVLTIGLLGYPYVLPDMIGGNAYGPNGEFLETLLPEKELYIRWLEVTAYLPSMQFSVVPWQFDQEVVDLARKFVDIHEKVVTPRLLDAIRQARDNGTPLIRPIWWVSPEDEVALTVDSQFMVGDSMLVAPVLEHGKRQRSIYLPAGSWTDELRGCTIHGPQWLHEYKVELDEVANFVKL